MSNSVMTWILLALAFVAANLPWLSERIFFMLTPKSGQKVPLWRWFEWLVLYFIAGAMAIGMEYKVTGTRYPQDWEFYAVTVCLFLVFALPGFIYRHDLKHHLTR